jgi:hypothetical protein
MRSKRDTDIKWVREDNKDMFDKFDGYLVLRCTDVEVFHQSRSDEHVLLHQWTPRRFTYVFDVTDNKLSDSKSVLECTGLVHQSRIFDAEHGWARFSSMRSLANAILRSCTPVQLKTTVTQPFELVKLQDFDFVAHVDIHANSDTGIGDGTDNSSSFRTCNGDYTCVAHYNCVFKPVHGSKLCHYHHKMMLQVWDGLSIDEQSDLSDTFEKTKVHWLNDFQDDVSFIQPTDDYMVSMLAALHDSYQKTFTLWAVDTEFATIAGAHAIPFAISVRDVRSNHVILSTSIDYLTEMQLKIAEHQGKRGASTWCKAPYFSRFYSGSSTTKGMSLAAVGQHLRKAGFTPQTHRLLSWYTPIDLNVICRSLLGDSQLFNETPADKLRLHVQAVDRECLQLFDVARMMRGCTNLSACRLGYTFRSLFPAERDLQMHDPDNDTLAMVKVFHVLRRASRGWVS